MKFEHILLQALLLTLDEKYLIYQICGDLDNDLLNIGIKGQFEN
jgi:hypothetical protein